MGDIVLPLTLSYLLTVSISMSIVPEACKEIICLVVEEIAKVEENVFSKFLLGATIQDGGMRERRNDGHISFHELRKKQKLNQEN